MLEEYIFNYELPMFLRNNKKAQKISMLKLAPKTVNIGIVDYLDFGTAYLNLYKQFEQPDLLGEKAASESERIDMDNFDEYFNFLLSTKSKKYLLNNSDNLKGHIIFRYFDFRKKMEYEFAQQLWQEAREKGINTLTYVLPKGEMGLLPTELRKAEVLEYSSKHRYVDLRINAQLSNNSIMRNPFNNNERS